MSRNSQPDKLLEAEQLRLDRLLIQASKTWGTTRDEQEKSYSIPSLLEMGANPNFEDELGNTALFYAAVSTNKKNVTLLLERGASINHTNRDHETALDHALTKKGNDAIISLLKEKKAISASSTSKIIASASANTVANQRSEDIDSISYISSSSDEYDSSDEDDLRFSTITNSDSIKDDVFGLIDENIIYDSNSDSGNSLTNTPCSSPTPQEEGVIGSLLNLIGKSFRSNPNVNSPNSTSRQKLGGGESR